MRGRGDHGRRWYLFDRLGSVLAEVIPTGTITSSRNYDVYGNVRSGVNPNGTSAHKFVGNLGHPSDNNTGLIYMQARYMDPATGTFLNEDTGRHGKNWFVYCSDSPVNRTDSNGRDDEFFNLLDMAIQAFNSYYAGKFTLQQAIGYLNYIRYDINAFAAGEIEEGSALQFDVPLEFVVDLIEPSLVIDLEALKSAVQIGFWGTGAAAIEASYTIGLMIAMIDCN